MAKNKGNQKSDAPETPATENGATVEQTPAKDRQPKGSSLTAQIKSHFVAIMTAFQTAQSLDDLHDVLTAGIGTFNKIPAGSVSSGVDLKTRLAQVTKQIDDMLSGAVEMKKDDLRALLNRQQRLEKEIADAANTAKSDTASA